jgi:2-acylglycerol O-acyltransferase 2
MSTTAETLQHQQQRIRIDSFDDEVDNDPKSLEKATVVVLDSALDTLQATLSPFVYAPAMLFGLTAFYGYFVEGWSLLSTYILACLMGYLTESIREVLIRTLEGEEGLLGDETILGTILYTVPVLFLLKIWTSVSRLVFLPLATLPLPPSEPVPENVPIIRRKQTAAVLFFIAMLPLTIAAYSTAIMLLLFPLTTIPMALYLVWILIIDKSPVNGKRTPTLRSLHMWKHFCKYFPITLERHSEPLDPEKKYVFVFSPHGIISVSAFGSFATDGNGFSEQFPGIDLRLMTLHQNFRVPFLRELLLSLGICSVARHSCDTVLGRGSGSAICIVVGGAAEALEAEKGTLRVILNRKGFVRVAVENHALLVPVISFGENDVFETLVSSYDSKLRQWQKWGQAKLGFSIPLFWGRGVTSYNIGFMPKRRPIYVYTGPPIDPDVFRAQGLEGEALISAVHVEYVSKFKELYDECKNLNSAGLSRKESLRFLQ